MATGQNEQVSRLLRCRLPKSIEVRRDAPHDNEITVWGCSKRFGPLR
jgi:hypothetical protein